MSDGLTSISATRIRITKNAELVIEQMRQLGEKGFGYNVASIDFLEGFIERQRERNDLSDATREGLINTFGSYLGQCMVELLGGLWCMHEGDWCIYFDGDLFAYPFSGVAKQFEQGAAAGDGVLSYYHSVVALSAAFRPKQP